jgi:hypothetical protein
MKTDLLCSATRCMNTSTCWFVCLLNLLHQLQVTICSVSWGLKMVSSWHQSWPPPWSSGQSVWIQIQRSGFDSRRYQIFWEVVGLERGPLSLLSTTEELLERESSGSGLENREYFHRDTPRWPRDILYPQKLALASPTSGSRSVGMVRSRTQATEFVCLFWHQSCFLFRRFQLQTLLRRQALLNEILWLS